MTNIANSVLATTEDAVRAQSILCHMQDATLMGTGFTTFGPIPGGIEMDFHLARPYGHRSIEIVSDSNEHLYTVTVYRFGKNFKKHLVMTTPNVWITALDNAVWQGVNKSCE